MMWAAVRDSEMSASTFVLGREPSTEYENGFAPI
jgi:hypothetical protein